MNLPPRSVHFVYKLINNLFEQISSSLFFDLLLGEHGQQQRETRKLGVFVDHDHNGEPQEQFV